jgi:hypothetical protein
MTLGVTLAIIVIMLLAINLIVVLIYVAPILIELRKTLGHVTSITATADERVKKIDQAIDGVSAALGAIKNLKTMTDPIANLMRKRNKRKTKTAEEESN